MQLPSPKSLAKYAFRQHIRSIHHLLMLYSFRTADFSTVNSCIPSEDCCKHKEIQCTAYCIYTRERVIRECVRVCTPEWKLGFTCFYSLFKLPFLRLKVKLHSEREPIIHLVLWIIKWTHCTDFRRHSGHRVSLALRDSVAWEEMLSGQWFANFSSFML